MIYMHFSEFSLLEWKLNHGIPVTALVESPNSDILFYYLGLAVYLKDEQCQIDLLDSENGWKNGMSKGMVVFPLLQIMLL